MSLTKPADHVACCRMAPITGTETALPSIMPMVRLDNDEGADVAGIMSFGLKPGAWWVGLMLWGDSRRRGHRTIDD